VDAFKRFKTLTSGCYFRCRFQNVAAINFVVCEASQQKESRDCLPTNLERHYIGAVMMLSHSGRDMSI